MMKTIVTLGPASSDLETIQKLTNYTKIFRLNGSHSSISWHKQTIKNIRKICPNAFILMDIPGIKPRTANEASVSISKDQIITFGCVKSKCNHLHIKLTKPLPQSAGESKFFSVNDGQFLFETKDRSKEFITGVSKSNFDLMPKKGLNLPYSIYDEDKQLEIYEDFIAEVSKLEIDGLGLSFVQTGELVDKVRKYAGDLVLISKIENTAGLQNCKDIINKSDAIMIDRGDLAAEIGVENLFNAIEELSNVTKAHGKPLIMATENLESMLKREMPSKSEVMSIAHSASIGVDCIMLSEETAISDAAVNIVEWLDNFLRTCPRRNKPISRTSIQKKFPTIWMAFNNFRHLPTIIVSKSGYALFDYFSEMPDGNAILFTDNDKTLKISELYASKIKAIKTTIDQNIPIENIRSIVAANKDILFEKSNQIVALYVSKYVKVSRANTITVFDKDDFN